MRRSPALAAVSVLLLAAMAVAAYWHWWGVFALTGMLAGCALWYRAQVRKSEGPQEDMDQMGEETRMASVQGGASPSELAADAARELHADQPADPP